MDQHYHMVAYFVEEIFGLFLPQFGMVKCIGSALVGIKLQFISGKGVRKQMESIIYTDM
jgi:hypothetical protein